MGDSQVLTASNGLDALRVFEWNKREVDLVITDMVMPDLSGAALISMIRSKSADIPIKYRLHPIDAIDCFLLESTYDLAHHWTPQ